MTSCIASLPPKIDHIWQLGGTSGNVSVAPLDRLWFVCVRHDQAWQARARRKTRDIAR